MATNYQNNLLKPLLFLKWALKSWTHCKPLVVSRFITNSKKSASWSRSLLRAYVWASHITYQSLSFYSGCINQEKRNYSRYFKQREFNTGKWLQTCWPGYRRKGRQLFRSHALAFHWSCWNHQYQCLCCWARTQRLQLLPLTNKQDGYFFLPSNHTWVLPSAV